MDCSSIPRKCIFFLGCVWQIPNLITAIYFAIFFLNPNFTLIKKCANPTCDEYFDVLKSNKRKNIAVQVALTS